MQQFKTPADWWRQWFSTNLRMKQGGLWMWWTPLEELHSHHFHKEKINTDRPVTILSALPGTTGRRHQHGEDWKGTHPQSLSIKNRYYVTDFFSIRWYWSNLIATKKWIDFRCPARIKCLSKNTSFTNSHKACVNFRGECPNLKDFYHLILFNSVTLSGLRNGG